MRIIPPLPIPQPTEKIASQDRMKCVRRCCHHAQQLAGTSHDPVCQTAQHCFVLWLQEHLIPQMGEHRGCACKEEGHGSLCHHLLQAGNASRQETMNAKTTAMYFHQFQVLHEGMATPARTQPHYLSTIAMELNNMCCILACLNTY